jgi:hypothetical protein
MSVLWFVLLGDLVLQASGEYKGRLARLILASRCGRFPDSWSVMTRRPKFMLQLLPHHVDLLSRNPPRSCLVRQVLMLC